MSTSPIGSPSPLDSASSSSSQAAANSTSDLANQNVFLQLLVAQLKNQDPESPADGTTFITQLAQFTEVSNTTQMAGSLTSIQQELTPAVPPTTAPATPAATTPTTNNSTSGS
jgi:flagellar basal-body rod modification protein FlgD